MAGYDFIISQSPKSSTVSVWRFDPHKEEPFKEVKLDSKTSRIKKGYRIAQVGRYLLQWGPAKAPKGNSESDGTFPFSLTSFDPASKKPFGSEPLQQGEWQTSKFWGGRIDFSNPHGDHHQEFVQSHLALIPFGTFILNWIPTAGRGTYHLFNFDPKDKDVIPEYAVGPQEPWGDIQTGHELIPICSSYMLDREVSTGNYRLWSFDPQSRDPITFPPVAQGAWYDIDASHQLVPIGEHILDWVAADRSYRIWKFDPTAPNPLTGPVASGTLPKGIKADSILTGVQPPIPVSKSSAKQPGSMDFLRSKIKHVVYYMIENRSLDHVCGWLYENDAPAHFIGHDRPYDGASTEFYNEGYNEKGELQKYYLSKYKGGKLSNKYNLELLDGADPYHEQSDVMRQMFYQNTHGYQNREQPNMGGFVWNNGNPNVMETYSPEQLPILNGLAKEFAISDEWFCSMPGGTDVNRAFSLAGSSYNMMNNFQNPPEYEYWPQQTHRPSIWKILWSHGFTDWKIYNSTEWIEEIFTDQLFLAGQIPTVDANKKDYVQFIDEFYLDCINGTLPAFSYVEPIWCAQSGSTSYHPGGDLIPGEIQLNKIYNYLRESPAWEDTLLVITFDEHGGLYDHAKPPYAVNPYPNDGHDGFSFDQLGPRVPTILVSPWIDKKTVFRSSETTKYDSTSILATLLNWYGIPRPQWGMGERVNQAPTFEAVVQREQARKTSKTLEIPYDQSFPKKKKPRKVKRPLHGLEKLMVPRVIWHIANRDMSYKEIQHYTRELMKHEDDHEYVMKELADLAKRLA